MQHKIAMSAGSVLLFLVACSGTEDKSQLVADTSGCTPIRELRAQTTTTYGRKLLLKGKKVNNPSCWNRGDAGLEITLEWIQARDAKIPQQGSFWISVNDAKETVNINQISCSTLSADTMLCSIQSLVKGAPLFTPSKWNIEIAPVLDGVWDTNGFEQNYKFTL